MSSNTAFFSRVHSPGTAAGVSGAEVSFAWMWATGPAVAAIVIVAALHPVAGRAADFSQYIVQGTIVPLVLLIYVLAERRWRPAWLRPVRMVLGGTAVLGATALVVDHAQRAAVLLAVLQVGITFAIGWSSSVRAPVLVTALRTVFLALCAWTAALTLVWWRPLAGSSMALMDGTGATGGFGSAAVLLLVLAVVFAACFLTFGMSSPAQRRWPRWIPVILAAAAFLYAGAQTLGLSDPSSAATWGFFVGTAELVRQGGWILWDVPSQYGFLGLLLVAWMPLHSVWESLYVINAAANVAMALLVYSTLRGGDGGVLRWGAAVLITVVVVFLRAGLAPYFMGAPVFPSTGGFRFLFCIALLVILLRVATQPAHGASGAWLAVGSVVWLIALAWSSEDAVYASATWLPAYTLLAWQHARGDRWRFARLAAAPLAAAAALAVLVSLVYMVRIGHAPDPAAYLEYAAAYTGFATGTAGGVNNLVANPSGPALAVLFVLAMLAAVWMLVARRHGLAHPATAYATGAFFAVWATSSYFVTRSHPNNAVNIAPVMVVALVGAWRLAGVTGAAQLRRVLQAVLIPVVGALLIGALAYPGAVATYVHTVPAASASVQSLFWNSPPVAAFMASAGIPATAAVVVLDDPIASFLPPSRRGDPAYWLPLAPAGEINLLSPAARLAHLQRWIARHRMSGWLIAQPRYAMSYSWLTRALGSWYRTTRTVARGMWTATYFSYRGPGP